MTNDIQTRSEENGLKFFDNPRDAFEHSRKDKTVWKISLPGDVRLVREMGTDMWTYAPMSDIINEFPKV
jgi:hypothetical protein